MLQVDVSESIEWGRIVDEILVGQKYLEHEQKKQHAHKTNLFVAHAEILIPAIIRDVAHCDSNAALLRVESQSKSVIVVVVGEEVVVEEAGDSE